MIKYIPIHKATCDICGQEVMQSNVTQVQFLIFVRGINWTVGNTVLCPLCREVVKKTKEKNQNYEQMQLDLEVLKQCQS